MTALDIDHARFNMVEQQVRPAKVLNPAVIDALHQCRRESFVAERYLGLAFADTQLPIGYGAEMFPPKLESLAAQALGLSKTDKVLEVGTGSGYMASLLGQLAGQVKSVEIVPELVVEARERLKSVGADNVTVHEGNGLLGLPGDAPFDAIMVSGSLSEMPRALLDQMKIGGRAFVIIGDAPAMQAQRITRLAADQWQTEGLFETTVGRLCEPPAQRFVF